MHVRNTKTSSYGLCLLLLALLVISVHGNSGSSKEGNPKEQQHKKNKLSTTTAKTTTLNENGNAKHEQEHETKPKSKTKSAPVPCTCAIFLSGQFKKGSKSAPKGEPVVTEELEMHFAHNSIGQRQCSNKCIENIIKYLPKSGDIICSTIDRDCHKEKAYLFTKNYDDKWVNSNMSAGRPFCCKDNKPYKCSLI